MFKTAGRSQPSLRLPVFVPLVLMTLIFLGLLTIPGVEDVFDQGTIAAVVAAAAGVYAVAFILFQRFGVDHLARLERLGMGLLNAPPLLWITISFAATSIFASKRVDIPQGFDGVTGRARQGNLEVSCKGFGIDSRHNAGENII